jgi:serine palmitoyltransferase
LNDLRHVLEKASQQDEALKRRRTDGRRFLVVEGLYKNWGTFAPLREIVALKEEFGYRLILDDSHAVGVLRRMREGVVGEVGVEAHEALRDFDV